MKKTNVLLRLLVLAARAAGYGSGCCSRLLQHLFPLARTELQLAQLLRNYNRINIYSINLFSASGN